MSGFGSRPTAAPIPVADNRRALAEALLGFPARVGQAFTGMANAGLQANEAFLQGRGQDGEDMLARPLLPGADTGGRLGALASFIGSNMAMGGPAGSLGAGPSMPSKGIRAYHGSPHDFDRFDLSKIGTGEGAQAYGHGLYFAENEGVARAYRDQLAKGFTGTDGAPLPRAMQQALEFVHPKFKGMGDMRAGLEDAIRRMADQSEFYRKTYGDGWNIYDGALEKLRAVDPATIKPAGRMYEVNIRARPEQFLDWDAPLGQQTPEVQNIIRQFATQAPEPKNNPAKRNREAILSGDASVPGDVLYNNVGGWRLPAETSAALRDAGIPGIRYLDQGSRAAGDGSRNYVVFDDKLIDILRKYGLAGLTAGGVGMAAGGEAQANPLAGALLGYQPQE